MLDLAGMSTNLSGEAALLLPETDLTRACKGAPRSSRVKVKGGAAIAPPSAQTKTVKGLSATVVTGSALHFSRSATQTLYGCPNLERYSAEFMNPLTNRR